jgi:hypothetical protein
VRQGHNNRANRGKTADESEHGTFVDHGIILISFEDGFAPDGAAVTRPQSERQGLACKDQRRRTAEHDHPPRKIRRRDATGSNGERVSEGDGALHGATFAANP